MVGAVTPITNPIVTPMCNGMFALKTGNAVIFAPHPKAEKCTVFLTNEFDDPLEGFDTNTYVPCLRTDTLVFQLDKPETRRRLARAGLHNVRLVAIESETDAHVKRLRGSIDRVLVDAPC